MSKVNHLLLVTCKCAHRQEQHEGKCIVPGCGCVRFRPEAQRVHAFATDDEEKCGGCNWHATTFYNLGPSIGMDPETGRPDGLCGDCFAQSLVDMAVVEAES